MESTPPASASGSHRTLAAIVFTDVVGSSARMERNEVRTVGLLRRDFALMREICAEHEGVMLKTTGDGVLFRFNSAVQAVAFALAVQRRFAEQAKTLPAKETLQHRIGIHLGDVLIQDQDVMGDGVNIASRLQAEAEPGGICISQTVYDVVKNKLALQVVSLGPRDLKNITEAIPVYRLLLEAQELNSQMPFPAARSATGTSPFRRPLLLTALAATLALSFISGRMSNRPPAASADPGPVAVTNAPRNPGDPDGDRLRREKLNLQQARGQYQSYFDKYDFEGLARVLKEKLDDGTAGGGSQLLLRSAEQMAAMKEWLPTALRQHSRENPLRVADLSGDATRESRVYVAADRTMHISDGAGTRLADWHELMPITLGNIIVSAMRGAQPAPPRDVTQGAQAFARAYNLVAMQEALGPARGRREKNTPAK